VNGRCSRWDTTQSLQSNSRLEAKMVSIPKCSKMSGFTTRGSTKTFWSTGPNQDKSSNLKSLSIRQSKRWPHQEMSKRLERHRWIVLSTLWEAAIVKHLEILTELTAMGSTRLKSAPTFKLIRLESQTIPPRQSLKTFRSLIIILRSMQSTCGSCLKK